MSLCDVVHQRARVDGQAIAYTFLADGTGAGRSITWAQLDERARTLGAFLQDRGAAGHRVLLALPSGLSFVESLFGCWYAGAIAVPVSLPRHQRVKHRLHQIVADAQARFAIGSDEMRARVKGDGKLSSLGDLSWLDPDAAGEASSLASPSARQDIAVLQYTSGSTGMPRGVMVTHANLMRNSAHIAEACGHAPGQTIAGWLPLFHDMGLIGLVLQVAFSGARLVFMPPERFLMRPWQWLEMISDYRATGSPAPNFAYDLCVEKVTAEHKAGLDLSCWRNALNGSEPVRASTLDRFASAFAECGFAKTAFFPCYGLAESTLFVTGPGQSRQLARRASDGRALPDNGTGGHIGCGLPAGDTQVALVDPKTRTRVAAGAVGEIWVAGQSVAAGYWNNPQATADTFGATLEGGCGTWLRTGDLGFVADGHLFITGRLKELIIIAGRNLFPIDLERTAENADPVIAMSGAAAFSVDIGGEERLIILAEVQRHYARSAEAATLDCAAIGRRIRAAIAAEHEVAAHEVVVLQPGALPRTTSGKISRSSARDAYLNQSLQPMEPSFHASAVR